MNRFLCIMVGVGFCFISYPALSQDTLYTTQGAIECPKLKIDIDSLDCIVNLNYDSEQSQSPSLNLNWAYADVKLCRFLTNEESKWMKCNFIHTGTAWGSKIGGISFEYSKGYRVDVYLKESFDFFKYFIFEEKSNSYFRKKKIKNQEQFEQLLSTLTISTIEVYNDKLRHNH